MYLLTTYF